MTPLTGSRRLVAVTDHVGQVRTGPPGAWWSNLKPRPTHRLADVRMDVELPSGRAIAWNVAFVAWLVVMATVAWVTGLTWDNHFAFALGLTAALVAALGIRVRRHLKHAARTPREGHQASQPQSTGQPQPQPHPALTASQ